MVNIYTCNERIKFKLICHTSIGSPKDIYARYFVKGMEYNAILEPRGNCGEDSNNEIFTSVWVSFVNPGYGRRFSVVGNIYMDDKPIWNDFKRCNTL